MSLLRVDASIRQEGSVSRELADTIERVWKEQHPGVAIVRRDLAATPIPAEVWQLAALSGFVGEDERSSEQVAAREHAAELADELINADAVVVAAPLYNFGVPSQLKAWIDTVITDQRFAPGTTPLEGKPVTLAVARGGGYGPGTPREGWDHATPYLERIFGDVFAGEVTVVAAELTLADINPAMAQLKDAAAASRAAAKELAEATAKAHAARRGESAA